MIMTDTQPSILPPVSMPVPRPAPIGAGMGIVGIIERYVRDPSIDVVKLEGMVALQERLMRWEAETAWNTAMAEAQSRTHAISRDSTNPQTRSRYASYAAIDAVLRPIYSELGFALSFNTEESRENWIKVVCDVTKGGHSKRYQIEMPADGKGARGNEVMTRTHATGSAVTYSMRYLAAMIFNLAMTDDDGNGAGRNDARSAQTGPNERYVRRPPPPAPNVMPPHDSETGEIIDANAPSDAGEHESDLHRRYDAALAEAAEQGTAKLAAVWRAIPVSSHKILMAAKDQRYKPRAAEVDSMKRDQHDTETPQAFVEARRERDGGWPGE